MTIRAVVFDMDGLMFNTEDVYTLVGDELLKRRGHVFTTEVKNAIMGTPPQASFPYMIRHYGLNENWQDMQTESNQLFISLLHEHLAPMPGLFELLDALEQAGIPKAIGTSSRLETADACLKPFDLQKRFQFILTAEDIIQGKPNPEIYLTAAKRFGIPLVEMAVLEDSQNGCLAASSAGAFAVAVPGEHSQTHNFDSASLVIGSLADPRLYQALEIGRSA
jgi:HAD superfamily hydrolase (TIGR01509 family)